MSSAGTNLVNDRGTTLEQVLIQGDLAKLSPEQRTQYYMAVCQSVGLNHLTRPLEYIVLNGKLTLYARKDATDQLRKIHNVSIQITSRQLDGDIYSVTAKAVDKSGRFDESMGAVTLGKMTGDARANLTMKAETKAKRRVTLSICGLGLLDETEVQDIPNISSETKPDKTPASALLSDDEVSEIINCAKKANWKSEDIQEYLTKSGIHVSGFKHLNRLQSKKLCDTMDRFPKTPGDSLRSKKTAEEKVVSEVPKVENVRMSGPREGTNATGGVISQAQITRLMAIGAKNGWYDPDIKERILSFYGLKSKTELSRDQYDELIADIERNSKTEVAS